MQPYPNNLSKKHMQSVAILQYLSLLFLAHDMFAADTSQGKLQTVYPPTLQILLPKGWMSSFKTPEMDMYWTFVRGKRICFKRLSFSPILIKKFEHWDIRLVMIGQHLQW